MPSYLQKVDEVIGLHKEYAKNRRDMYILDLELLVSFYWQTRYSDETISTNSDRVGLITADIEIDMQRLLEKPHFRTSCKEFDMTEEIIH